MRYSFIWLTLYLALNSADRTVLMENNLCDESKLVEFDDVAREIWPGLRIVNLRNSNGSAIVVVLIALLIFAIGTGAIAQYWTMVAKMQKRQKLLNTIAQIQENLTNSIGSNPSWQTTLNDPKNDPCLQISPYAPGSCTGQNFTLWGAAATNAEYAPDANGFRSDPALHPHLVYDGQNPAAGFDAGGQLCSTYNPAGSDTCPIHLNLTTTSGLFLTQPVHLMQATLVYSPTASSSVGSINGANYSISNIAGLGDYPSGCTSQPPSNPPCPTPDFWACTIGWFGSTTWICGQIYGPPIL